MKYNKIYHTHEHDYLPLRPQTCRDRNDTVRQHARDFLERLHNIGVYVPHLLDLLPVPQQAPFSVAVLNCLMVARSAVPGSSHHAAGTC